METLNTKTILLILGILFVLYIAVTGTLPVSVINVALGLIWGAVVINALWKQAVK